MGIAFEMAVGSLRTTPGYDDPVRAVLAHNIIALAKAGERDPERLCEAALKGISPPNPRPGSPPPAEAPEGGQAAEGWPARVRISLSLSANTMAASVASILQLLYRIALRRAVRRDTFLKHPLQMQQRFV
jgi:hypothetical protein